MKNADLYNEIHAYIETLSMHEVIEKAKDYARKELYDMSFMLRGAVADAMYLEIVSPREREDV